MGAVQRGQPPLLRSILHLGVLFLCCHAQENHHPCRVVVDENKLDVICYEIDDFAAVTQSLTTPDQKVSGLRISNSPLLVLTRENFDHPAFKTLEKVDLENIEIISFNPELFQGLSSLSDLSLESNNITLLNANAFYGLENLTALSVTRNEITDIDPTAFRSLPNLNYLDLRHNRLTSINEEGPLTSLVKLERLSLMANKIKTIDYRAFQTLNNLKVVLLGGNDLESLDSRLFENTPIVALDVSYNPLEDLAKFPLNSSTLQALGLIACDIQTIPVNYFENVPNLIILELNNNKISQIDAGLLSPLTELRSLSLRSNRLVSLNVDSFQQVYRILNRPIPVTISPWKMTRVRKTLVDFRNNPWDCSTDNMREVRTWASQHNVDFDNIFNNCSAAVKVTDAP